MATKVPSLSVERLESRVVPDGGLVRVAPTDPFLGHPADDWKKVAGPVMGSRHGRQGSRVRIPTHPGGPVMTRPTARPALLALATLLLAVLGYGTAVRAGDPAGERTVAITNVTVIDGTTGVARPDATILIRGDRIAAVGPSASTPVPPGAAVIDGRGLLLIPGLRGMPARPDDPAPPDLFPRHGVAGVRPVYSVHEDYYPPTPLPAWPALPALPRGVAADGTWQMPVPTRFAPGSGFAARNPLPGLPPSAAPPRTGPRAEPPPPPPAVTLPHRTVTPAGRPVPIALTLPDLEAYKAAAAGGRKAVTDRMVEDGIVQLVTAPTRVRYERTWRGHDYVRTLDGPLEGRLLVMDAGFLK
jgi:hypothetical protein